VKRFALAAVILSFSCLSLAIDMPKPVASNPHPNEATLRQQKLDALHAMQPNPDATADCSFTFPPALTTTRWSIV
jgi:hypothetical protein